MREETIKQNLKNPSSWKRLLYMILFVVLYGVAELILTVIILFQVAVNLLTNDKNERLAVLGKQISRYVYDILLYLTYNSERRPFPFSDWPTDSNLRSHVSRTTSMNADNQ